MEERNAALGASAEGTGEETYPVWPTQVMNQLIILYLLGGLLVSLAILMPFQLQAPADPLGSPAMVKPEWYFLPVYQTVKYVPKMAGVILFLIAALMLLWWPVIDSRLDRRFGVRAHRKVGWAVLAALLLLGAIGWFSARNFTLFGQSWRLDTFGVPHHVVNSTSPEIPAP